jgi:Pyruvate/2-oxoacid:ferredoxin oxidoreductase delta subunit
MCEFCHKHGEGKKWYLNASNYSEELFTEASRTVAREVMSNLTSTPVRAQEPPPVWDAAVRMAPSLAQWIARRHQQDVHWGQVVPLEDALEVVDLTDWVVRLPCVCRSNTVGDRNARYCFGIGIGPTEEPWRRFFTGILDPALSVETLTKDQTREALTDLDRKGAMHSVWTFKSPYIGGLCNCDRDCGAWRAQMQHSFQVMFRSEYVASIDPDKCGGCRRCKGQCLFGAVTHSLTQGKCGIDERACYGCGVCRAKCDRGAISLVPRAGVTAAAGVWGL